MRRNLARWSASHSTSSAMSGACGSADGSRPSGIDSDFRGDAPVGAALHGRSTADHLGIGGGVDGV